MYLAEVPRLCALCFMLCIAVAKQHHVLPSTYREFGDLGIGEDQYQPAASLIIFNIVPKIPLYEDTRYLYGSFTIFRTSFCIHVN